MKLKQGVAAISVSLLGASTTLAAQLTIPAAVDGAVQYSGVLGYSVFTDEPSNRTSMSGGNNVRDAIYEFDLSPLPDDAVITGAALLLTTSGLVSNTSSTATITFYGFVGDGAITQDDHGNLSADAQIAEQTYAVGGSGPSVGSQLSIALDDIAVLQAALDDEGSDYFGVRSETVSFVTFSVHSLEHEESTNVAPQLAITYVPEPGGLWLLTLAALPLLRRR